jgi:deoxyribodipyrimidine photo-lyase
MTAPSLKRACVWLREDLRLQDHQGFIQAQQGNGLEQREVLALYIFTPKTTASHDKSLIQMNFILESLRALRESLESLGIPLKILMLNVFDDIPEALGKFCEEHEISDVYASSYYGWDERQRDDACKNALIKKSVKIHYRHGFVVFSPLDILKADRTPYLVFTPYKRAWIQKLLSLEENFSVRSSQKLIKNQGKALLKLCPSDPLPLLEDFSGDKPWELWVLTEKALHQKLKKFVREAVLNYADSRDFPALHGTSEFSPYLAQGILTPKQILLALTTEYSGDFLTLFSKKGIEVFIGELIWRDFYQMVLYHFPEVSKHQPLKKTGREIHWTSGKQAEIYFDAWCQGKTGFPLVDAAMRCLNKTGFMHNRLRMITAMFLSKLLLLDWRWGERYFMQHLIDGELGANNGGWQWCASTGTDAVPYFRIFNPTTQSERFDPEGEFIRQYVPELAALSAKQIHNPSFAEREACRYPQPVIDYAFQRKKALGK